ncbi:IpaD/SipD/SspD family type III secretion system needle tip protein [Proteus sp. FME41]|uniref:IpaD/SipD/SspD family type III secretion system needle tip protein n=1 Tax=Proteus sp. FME41 TaxID=2742608 RepID=UPI001D02F225|nr:IpaD/SipD/SspD family type III secretion system needle tip protein [Proteus sp. FME41]
MFKAIDSGMSNIANYSKSYSSPNDVVSKSKNEKQILDNMEDLLINIRREYKNFDLENWIDCNNLKEKSEREISISLSEKYATNMIGNKKCLDSINKLAPIIKDTLSNQGYLTDSLSEFFYEVKQTIIVGKNDYLDVLKSIFSNYMDYVRDVRTAITSISQYTKAGKKEGYILVDYHNFRKKLENVKKEYNEKLGDKNFFHIQALFETKSEGSYIRKIDNHQIYYKNEHQIDSALHAIEKLLTDIKGITIKKEDHSSEGSIKFDFIGSINFDDLDKFSDKIKEKESKEKKITEEELQQKRRDYINNLKKDFFYKISTGKLREIRDEAHEHDADKKVKKWREENNEKLLSNILQTEFDLFKKLLDALEKKLNTNLDELSKKYSSANSNYDNFVKIVSSTINTLLEMAKGFLRF